MGGIGLRGIVRAAGFAAIVGLTTGVAAPRAAQAALIWTASLEQVVSQSSHVALGTWDPTTRRFTVERWLRGDWPDPAIELWGASEALRSWRDGLDADFERLLEEAGVARGPHLGSRAIVCLEALDGRLHFAGHRRYGGGVTPHSSIRQLTADGHVFRYIQVENPGGPEPVDAEAATIGDFLPLLEDLLAKHPYAPPAIARPSIPPVHRAAFFTALGATIDWYEGDWPTTYPGFHSLVAEPKDAEAAAERLFAWAESVPREARLPALEAMLMLCTVIQGGGPDRTPILALAHRLLPDVDPEAALAWILRDVRHGGYYTNREELGRLAQDLGPVPEEKTLDALEEVATESSGSLGTSAYWALKNLGQDERAEAALARSRVNEAKAAPGK